MAVLVVAGAEELLEVGELVEVVGELVVGGAVGDLLVGGAVGDLLVGGAVGDLRVVGDECTVGFAVGELLRVA